MKNLILSFSILMMETLKTYKRFIGPVMMPAGDLLAVTCLTRLMESIARDGDFVELGGTVAAIVAPLQTLYGTNRPAYNEVMGKIKELHRLVHALVIESPEGPPDVPESIRNAFPDLLGPEMKL